MSQEQTELSFVVEPKGSDNVEWLCTFLGERSNIQSPTSNIQKSSNEPITNGSDGWTTAAEICSYMGWPATENKKRQIRAWADASEGRVIGHQKGYRLTTALTKEEYDWWRNEAMKSCSSIQRRVIETDRVFYAKTAVEPLVK